MNQEELEQLGEEYLHSKLFKDNQKIHQKELKIRDKFVENFNLKNLKKMSLDEYIEGKGSKSSFCYQIEVGMQSLGQIRGSFANSKFVIHYSEEKGDYVFESGKFGSELTEVFDNVKAEIIKLIEDGANDNYPGLDSNMLPRMFKGKIYYVYYPDKTLPIYNINHIDFFMKNIGLSVYDDMHYFEKLRLMLQWKNNSKVFNKFTNLDFMSFLYSSYGFEKEVNILKGKKDFNNLDIEFIQDKNVIDRYVKESSNSRRTPNFEEINRKKSAIGMNGELFVLEYEKNHNKKFSRKIKRVGDNPSFGYDILSFNSDGSEKHIEVKTCVSGNLNKIDFYISANEYSKLETDPHYVLYYVCGLSTKKAKIICLNKNNLNETTFEPIAYKIRGKLKEQH